MVCLVLGGLALVRLHELDSDVGADRADIRHPPLGDAASSGARNSSIVENKQAREQERDQGTGATRGDTSESETRALVERLRKAYSSGSVVSQFRIQSKLEQLWRIDRPSLKLLVGELHDDSSTESYRLFFAKKLRNSIKSTALVGAELSGGVEALQDILADSGESEVMRSQVAGVLAEIDQSPRTVESVAELLESSSDRAAASGVSALATAAGPDAMKRIATFAEQNVNFPDQRPEAVIGALAVLAAENAIDVVPLVGTLVRLTNTPKSLVGSATILGKVESSADALEAISAVYSSRTRFPEHADQIRRASKIALSRHEKFAALEGERLGGELNSALDLIRHSESVQ